jgi:hypothetical protein
VKQPWHSAALVACIAGALVTPLGGRAVSQACAASAVHIAIVVDTGTGSSVSAVCVPAGARDNGAMLLAARASMLGTPQPRYAPSGLLCAIDGYPATGCGEGQNGNFAYWSYWHGANGAWTYATTGPATTRVDPAIVEGWRWHPESAGSTTSPPRVAPAATAICKPAPPATAPTTVPVATHTTVGAASPGPAAGAASAGEVPVTTHPAAPHAGAAPPATTRGGPPRTTGVTSARRRTGGSGPATPTTRARGSEATSTTVALVQGGIATAARGSGSGVPVGLVLGGVLVVALFALGALAARRRRSTA